MVKVEGNYIYINDGTINIDHLLEYLETDLLQYIEIADIECSYDDWQMLIKEIISRVKTKE